MVASCARGPFFPNRRNSQMATVNKSRSVTPRNIRNKTKAEREAEQRFRMVQRVANLLKQISDPTRLQVIQILAEGERHVGALCETFNVTQPAVSHHLALLRHGGLIIPRRQGKNNF